MNIEHVKEFLVLTESKNYGEAAGRLHVSQPTLSRHICAIENELGVRLLERSNCGMTLTADGELAKRQFKCMLHYFNELMFTMEESTPSVGFVR